MKTRLKTSKYLNYFLKLMQTEDFATEIDQN